MNCKDVLVMLEKARMESLSESIQAHLSGCSACRDKWHAWQLLRAGFRAWAEDQAPNATFGFAARVIRRLDDVVDSGRGATEFIERVGRRFVLATLLLAMTLLLALVLPASGPFRGPATDEPYLSQPEVSPQNDVVFLTGDYTDAHPAIPVNSNIESEQKQK